MTNDEWEARYSKILNIVRVAHEVLEFSKPHRYNIMGIKTSKDVNIIGLLKEPFAPGSFEPFKAQFVQLVREEYKLVFDTYRLHVLMPAGGQVLQLERPTPENAVSWGLASPRNIHVLFDNGMPVG